MRVLRRNAVFLGLAVLIAGLPLFVSMALPAWGPRGCAPVGAFVVGQAKTSGWAWKVNGTNPEQVDLFDNGRQVGAWFHADGKYYSATGAEWVERDPPPGAPAPPLGKVEQNFGLDLSQLEHRQGVFLHDASGERQVSREEAADVIQNGLVDDRHKLQLTFISADKGRREAFLKAAASVTGLGEVVARAVPPDYLGLQDSETGKPLFQVAGDTVYLQKPDGQVLARMGGVRSGDFDLPVLARSLEAIRRPKPYEPDKDVDPRKPPKTPEPVKPSPALPAWAKDVPVGGWVLLGLAVLGGAMALGRFSPR